jgi:hypothetical protein
MFNIAVRDPVAVGVKVMLMTQVPAVDNEAPAEHVVPVATA